MGLCGKVTFLVFTVAAVFIGLKLNALFEVPPVPKLEDTWWGPGEPRKVDTAVKPFKINVPEKVIEDLNHRLKNSRPLTPPLEGIAHEYGYNTRHLSEIVDYWSNKYKWNERQNYLNTYPQFVTNIQGLNIHFIHVKPKNPKGLKVLPILLSHGWPGSVREFYEIIPLLTTPRGEDFVFEVVVPSLPGYVFSQGASKPGLGPAEIAVVLKNLMSRLGHEKFYVQGGDWGSMVTRNMAILFPENVLGMHSNMCSGEAPLARLLVLLGSLYPRLIVDEKNEHKLYPYSEYFQFMLLESGYLHIQATKPDTVGVGLDDSPVGLAAYILEKFVTATNKRWVSVNDDRLKSKFTYDALLDNVMLYWITGSMTTAARLYAEEFNSREQSLGMAKIPVLVPSACAQFDDEVLYSPKSLFGLRYKNLVQVTEIDGAGHFAAMEAPELLADDVWSAVVKMEAFYK